MARLCLPSLSGMGMLPRLLFSCSILPHKPEGCSLKVENNRRQRTQVSLYSFCDNSGSQMTVMLGGTGGTWLAYPFSSTVGRVARLLGTMRILPLFQLAVSISIYRIASCYGQHIPASLGQGGKGSSSTLPSSAQ